MTTLAAGDRVGRYVVEALLGRGGMGAVYRAFDDVLRRRVALKLVSTAGDGPADPENARRILREARMAAAFDHPNVVAVFDVGEHDGTPFIVMELVLGVSLRAFVGAGNVSPARRVRFLVAIARALAAAHENGLVHRDIKPENVMVRDDGAIKVLDFGIAAPSGRTVTPATIPEGAAASSTFATVDRGQVAGTPVYMAPELLLEGVFDARTDQFAWGVVAYELLVGVHPWPGATLDVRMRSMLTTDAPVLQADACGVPEKVAVAVGRALARNRALRFESMADLLEPLGEAAEGLAPIGASLPPAPLDAAPTLLGLAPTLELTSRDAPAGSSLTVPRSAPRSPKRRRLLFALGFLVSAAAGLSALFVARRHLPPRFEIRARHRLAFGAAYSENPSLSRDGKTLVYDAGESGEDQIYRVDLATNARAPLTTGKGWHYHAAVSPSGKEVAYIAATDHDRGTYVLPLDGSGSPRRVARGNVEPSWSPDGSAIWAGEVGRPSRYDAKTLEFQRSLDPMAFELYAVVVEFPDGRVVARAGDTTGEGLGLVLHAPGVAPRWIWRGHVSDSVAIVPGTSWLLASKTGGIGVDELWQIPIDDGEARRVAAPDVAPSLGITISADASRLAWSTAGSQGTLVSLASASADAFQLAAKAITERRRWSDDDVRYIAGSKRLLVASDRVDGVPMPWVIDPSGAGPPLQIPTGNKPITGMDVSHDGSMVAFSVAHEGLFVAPIDGSGAPRKITEGARDEVPSFAYDGKSLFFQRFRSDARFEIDRVPLAGGAVTRVRDGALTPTASVDGRTLAFFEGGAAGDPLPRLLDLETGAVRTLGVDVQPGRYLGARFSFDGRRIVLFSGQFALEVDLENGTILHRFDVGMDQLTGVTYTEAGLLASVRQWDGDVWIAEGTFR